MDPETRTLQRELFQVTYDITVLAHLDNDDGNIQKQTELSKRKTEIKEAMASIAIAKKKGIKPNAKHKRK